MKCPYYISPRPTFTAGLFQKIRIEGLVEPDLYLAFGRDRGSPAVRSTHQRNDACKSVSIVNYKLKQFFLLSFDAMYYGKLESKVIEIETVLFNCVKSK